MDLVLGIDLGTTNFKAGLFDCAGQLRGLGRVSVKPDTGPDGRCELPVERFESLVREAVAQALKAASATEPGIVAVSYGSQTNSFLLLDDANHALTPIILWPDRRSVEPEAELTRLVHDPDFALHTGLGIESSPALTLFKLAWLLRTQPEIWKQAARIMSISDYLMFLLTGRAIGDGATAELLGLYDIRAGAWWGPALAAAGVAEKQLSVPMIPGASAGVTSSPGVQRLGLTEGIAVAVGTLDHHAAALGAGVGVLAPVCDSTGTVVACLKLTTDERTVPGCIVGPGAGSGFYRAAFDENGAGGLNWYQRRHAVALTVDELAVLAGNIPPGSDGLSAIPCVQNWPDVEGFRSLSPFHRQGHFARAIMESTSATLADLVNHLSPEGFPQRIVATGGGARSPVWLQIKADMLGAEFVTVDCPEPASKGAAMLAAVRAGWFAEPAQAGSAWVKSLQVFKPDAKAHKFYRGWLAARSRS